MKAVYLNGRFLAQPVTGVQRVARELLGALDAHLAAVRAGPAPTAAARTAWVLLVPPGVEAPPLAEIERRAVGRGDGRGWRGHLWEQTALPRAARDGLLLNGSGSAPAFGDGARVATLHDAAVFDRPAAYTRSFVAWYRFLHRRLARRATALVTVSAFSQARLAAALGVAPDRIAVVPNGSDHLDRVVADAGVLARLGLAGVPFLLVVGSANPNKNLERVLAAWQLAARADARLVVVGAATPRVFRAKARAGPALPPLAPAGEGWGEGVVVAGPLDDAGLSALYRTARGLVFVSRYEGYGLPAAEAMRLGCPVLASREGALPEVCGDAALYAGADDTVGIASALCRLLDEPDLRDDLAARGRARMAARTWAATAARWEGLVDRLQRGSPAA